ncbi:hypothetical protein RFI_37540, partial [Reticulomyxa filosa]
LLFPKNCLAIENRKCNNKDNKKDKYVYFLKQNQLTVRKKKLSEVFFFGELKGFVKKDIIIFVFCKSKKECHYCSYSIFRWYFDHALE